ncbi:polyprenyl synthetase family protein [Ramlibacter sp. AW1]|uniref:Polyprenyl synthetase family protein n=2 Tax=Ramlibacter aurantiacus TaxID=2801330 RepID=A0A937D3F4_9BURK|nr:polyprenyl synthetase family protein [Ramlibacter aurantiacus]
MALRETSGTDTSVASMRMRIEARLAALLPRSTGAHDAVVNAMHAAVLGPGKRLRPLLTVRVGESLGCRSPGLLDLACAVELVHCASLVLDDMPAMDNAMQRRGEPTVHLRFGQDVAMLAAVALVTESMRVVAAAPGLPPAALAQAVQVLSVAIGPAGLVRGQWRDLHEDGAARTVAAAAEANAQKTGVLFAAAMELGAIAAGSTAVAADLRRAAFALGQAFQLRDDLEDMKPDGEDAGRYTLTQLLGAAAARSLLHAELHKCRQALAAAFGGPCGPIDSLLERAFADVALSPQPLHEVARVTPTASAEAS